VNLIFFLLIGLAAGWLAGQIVKRPGKGWLEDMIVGVVGAFVGGIVFSLFRIQAVGLLGELVSATVGAVILLLLLRKFRKL
jgi:uncharacterized membrane protein YeaQ/YmgE (transglycosylase-associated protein family)